MRTQATARDQVPNKKGLPYPKANGLFHTSPRATPWEHAPQTNHLALKARFMVWQCGFEGDSSIGTNQFTLTSRKNIATRQRCNI